MANTYFDDVSIEEASSGFVSYEEYRCSSYLKDYAEKHGITLAPAIRPIKKEEIKKDVETKEEIIVEEPKKVKQKSKANGSAIASFIFGLIMVAVLLVPYFYKVENTFIASLLNVVDGNDGITYALSVLNLEYALDLVSIYKIVSIYAFIVAVVLTAILVIVSLFSMATYKANTFLKVIATIIFVFAILGVVSVFLLGAEWNYGFIVIYALILIVCIATWCGKSNKKRIIEDGE